jgi:hypothetical protein
MNKKADLGDWLFPAIIAFALGALTVYLIAKGVLPIPLEICPA